MCSSDLRTVSIPAELMRDPRSASLGPELHDAAAGFPACIGALSFLGAAALGGAMVTEEKRILEVMRSG